MADTRLPILHPNRREGRFSASEASYPVIASRFSGAYKPFVSKQRADGVRVADIGRKARISQKTCSDWTKRCDRKLPPDRLCLKPLGDDNSKLRQRDTDLSWDRDIRQRHSPKSGACS